MVEDHAVLFGSLVPAGVVLETMPLSGFEPAAGDAILTPVEMAFVAQARPSRQREFLAGRLCARRALARLGITGVGAGASLPATPSLPSTPDAPGSMSAAGDIFGGGTRTLLIGVVLVAIVLVVLLKGR